MGRRKRNASSLFLERLYRGGVRAAGRQPRVRPSRGHAGSGARDRRGQSALPGADAGHARGGRDAGGKDPDPAHDPGRARGPARSARARRARRDRARRRGRQGVPRRRRRGAGSRGSAPVRLPASRGAGRQGIAEPRSLAGARPGGAAVPTRADPAGCVPRDPQAVARRAARAGRGVAPAERRAREPPSSRRWPVTTWSRATATGRSWARSARRNASLGRRAAELLASAGRRAFGRGDMPAAVNFLQRSVFAAPQRGSRPAGAA